MKLLEPMKIRNMLVKNRVLMPAMGVPIGYRSRRARAYYRERAIGGTGAILTGAMSVDLLVSDEAWERAGGVAEFVEGLRVVAKEVQEAGAKMGVQLLHANRFPAGRGPDDVRGEPIAPSPRLESIASRGVPRGEKERGLSQAEIQAIIDKYALAALRVKEAGFDFAEFHGAHIYLPCQFFSPLYNQRIDKYGGSLANRMRFGLECVAAMRERVGDFPLFYRIGAWEEEQGGITIDDAVAFSRELERAGVDALNVSVGAVDIDMLTPGINFRPGTYVHLSSAIKKAVNIPVVAVGRINTPELAEAILVAGKADMVAIGRQLIADPHWTAKVASGHAEDIVPCLSCNTCLDSGVWAGRELRCTVNPYAGRELEQDLTLTEPHKRVLVVGGGPAGIEAAIAAASRGHQVVIWEKAQELGGRMVQAALPPNKEALDRFRKHLVRQVDKAGVKVTLGHEATTDRVTAFKPDAVVVATGAEHAVPTIPGVENPNVMTAIEALTGAKKVSGKVIVIGGGMTGCETALFLAKQGRAVAILEALSDIGNDTGPSARNTLWRRVKEAGVVVHTGIKINCIEGKGVRATKQGSAEFFEAQTVVLATGMVSNKGLCPELEERGFSVLPIGDCVEPRKIVDAIAEGARAGREL